MACTSSIGPGALNMVTAAGVAHVNRLPVLFLPGDVFAGRGPDPVLQQVEDFADATVSANDCFRPVSRYFDRIQRPEQLIDSLPRALATMLDPATCGPATLAFCQDAQTEAADFPLSLFERRVWRIRRPAPDPREVDELAARLRAAKAPLIIAGGGRGLRRRRGGAGAARRGAQASRWPRPRRGGARWPWDHPLALGAIGVTGTSAANRRGRAGRPGDRRRHAAAGFHHRLARPVRQPRRRPWPRSTSAAFDAAKHGALAVVGDAGAALEALLPRGWPATARPKPGPQAARSGIEAWNARLARGHCARRPATGCPPTAR